MDPLLTNGIDPSLLRVIEKRGSERDTAPQRRRAPDKAHEKKNKSQEDENPDAPKHALDDLA
jgi:hypothetical protein